MVDRNSRLSQQVQVHHRSGGAKLYEDERDEQCDAHDAGRNHPGRRPRLERSFGDPVHQEPQSDAAEHETGDVEASGVDGVDLLQDERAEDDRHDADGHVDEEHPAPREVGDQKATEDRSHSGGHGCAEGQDAGRPHPFGRREDPVEHCHPDGRHHAAARPLHHTEDHQLRHVLRHATERRADRENDDGCQQNPFAAETVSQPSGRGNEDGQAHQVGDHDTIDGGRGDVEIAPDGGERDIHDRDVHDVHEHRRHEHDADCDLLIHADDGHGLFRFFGVRASGRLRVGDPTARLRSTTLCAGAVLLGPSLGSCPAEGSSPMVRVRGGDVSRTHAVPGAWPGVVCCRRADGGSAPSGTGHAPTRRRVEHGLAVQPRPSGGSVHHQSGGHGRERARGDAAVPRPDRAARRAASIASTCTRPSRGSQASTPTSTVQASERAAALVQASASPNGALCGHPCTAR